MNQDPFHITNQLFKIVLIAFILILLSLGGVIIYQNYDHKMKQAQILDNYTKVVDGFSMSAEMSDSERFFKFQRFTMRIMGTFGMTYSKDNLQAINPLEQADYIKFVWDAARLMKIDPYRIIAIHQLESCFNPHAYNTNSGLDEKGIGQQTWPTALYAKQLLDFLPPNLKTVFYFDIKISDDLFNWETSTKATFVLIYFLDREFNGRNEWADSVYHWGGFLRRYWDKGEGQIPYIFTFYKPGKGKVEYDVLAYYTTIQKLETAYNSGDLEYGKAVYTKYQEAEKKLMAEEIQLRNARGIVRRLKAELETEREAKERAIKRRDELEKTINEALVDINTIYGTAAKQKTGEQLRATLRLHRGVMVKVLKRLELDEMEKNISKLQELILILLGIMSIFPIIGVYIIRKRKKNNEQV